MRPIRNKKRSRSCCTSSRCLF